MGNLSKETIRFLKKKQRQCYPDILIKSDSVSIAEKLKCILNKNEMIGLFYPLNKEFDLISLLIDYNICIPKVINDFEMIFTPLVYPLNIGKYRIMESDSNEIVYPYPVIVPLLAFNQLGFRIGYGKGFYDRYFSKYNCLKIGVASEYMLESFNQNAYDVGLDIVVTPIRIIYFLR